MLALTLTDLCALFSSCQLFTATNKPSRLSSHHGFLLMRSECLLIYAPLLQRPFRSRPLTPLEMP